MKLPSKTYFERDSIEYLQKCRDVERVMIVTDHAMVELGFLDRIIEQLDLRRNKVVYQIFADVEPDPDITTVERGTEIMRAFKPDTIIALGWWITNGCGQSYVALLRTTRSGLP